MNLTTLPDTQSRLKCTNHIPAAHVFSKHAMRNLSPAKQFLFERFGQGPITSVPYACIHHAFEAQAKANPQAIAAQHLGDSITYQALDHQANRLAALLLQNGVSVGDNVALFLQRSIPMLVGLLATLKVGAKEAERAGLVARVIPANQLMAESLAAAETIAAYSKPATLVAKEAVDRALEVGLREGVLFERRTFHALFATADQKEGMRAFGETRQPHFNAHLTCNLST